MGLLVAIEGTDGAGKATQSALLVERARSEGFSAALLSFPDYGVSFFSQAIARFLNGDYGPRAQIPPFFRSLLFAAERFEEARKIGLLLQDNDLVVIDRYIASNIAYQVAELGEAEAEALTQEIIAMELEVFAVPRPDLTLYLKSDPGVSQAKVIEKETRGYRRAPLDINEADLSYLQAVHAAYERLIDRGHLGPWEEVACLDSSGALRKREIIAEGLWVLTEKYLEPKTLLED